MKIWNKSSNSPFTELAAQSFCMYVHWRFILRTKISLETYQESLKNFRYLHQKLSIRVIDINHNHTRRQKVIGTLGFAKGMFAKFTCKQCLSTISQDNIRVSFQEGCLKRKMQNADITSFETSHITSTKTHATFCCMHVYLRYSSTDITSFTFAELSRKGMSEGHCSLGCFLRCGHATI